MQIRKISLLHFKNIEEASLEFSSHINCLLGNNGMGKSNLLEAIHLLCMARGLTSAPESTMIGHDRETAMVKGEFLSDAAVSSEVACSLDRKRGKNLRKNGKEYSRISEHIGQYPVVVIAPADIALVSGGAETRRKLMDQVISQSDNAYLNALIQYTKALESRNKMLKAELRDPLLFEAVEQTMIETGHQINLKRRQWVEAINPVLSDYYSRIAEDREQCSVSYESALNHEGLKSLLEASRRKDYSLGFTSVGVHRDNMEMLIDGYNLRHEGSQGQLKTFIISLRLAIFKFIHAQRNCIPILLFDDMFDKLDSGRVDRIMRIISDRDTFGQVFITDTNRQHLDEIVAITGEEYKLIEVDNGQFHTICDAQNHEG